MKSIVCDIRRDEDTYNNVNCIQLNLVESRNVVTRFEKLSSCCTYIFFFFSFRFLEFHASSIERERDSVILLFNACNKIFIVELVVQEMSFSFPKRGFASKANLIFGNFDFFPSPFFFFLSLKREKQTGGAKMRKFLEYLRRIDRKFVD